MKSVSDLAFQTLDKLTDDEDELWVSHIVYDGQAKQTGKIQELMKQDCGVSYNAVRGILKRLVEKKIIHRVRIGIYAPNLNMLLPNMLLVLQEAEGG